MAIDAVAAFQVALLPSFSGRTLAGAVAKVEEDRWRHEERYDGLSPAEESGPWWAI
jgi:hypothetical protein